MNFDAPLGSVMISGITADSREVEHGMMFVALRGAKADGAAYIDQALERGAAALMVEEGAVPEPARFIPVVTVDHARRALAVCAAALYAPQPECIVAVTGTDGKTSTAEFTRQLFAGAGRRSVSIGTLGVRGTQDDARFPALNTTPDAALLHRTLRTLAREQVTHVAMEASSHGLDQYRLDGVRLKAAAFTNLTRDHLDYHGSEAAYFAAKLRLFSELLPAGETAVLNAGDPRFSVIEECCIAHRHRVVSFGPNGRDYRLISAEPHAEGQRVRMRLHEVEHQCDVPLVGRFQVMNILAALGLAEGAGMALDTLLPQLPHLQGVPGRLERVAVGKNGAPVFVDYAHTPAALANLLRTLRPHVAGRLWVVFGCGGDRDAGKRPQMGEAAAELADCVIVTDDNPRSEDPAFIRQAILAACPDALEIGDRAEAIQTAMAKLEPGDVLVIAGKGHEKTQTVGSHVLPFDDADVARAAAGLVDGNRKARTS